MANWQPLIVRRPCSPRDVFDCYFQSVTGRTSSPARHYDLDEALGTIEAELTRLLQPGDTILVDGKKYHSAREAMVALRAKYGTEPMSAASPVRQQTGQR
jgi:hypothetical protein